MNSKQILALVLIVIGVIILFCTLAYGIINYGGDLGTTKEIKGNCYDRNYNKINGVTCDIEVIEEYDLYVIAGLTLSPIIILLSLMLFVFGRNSDE